MVPTYLIKKIEQDFMEEVELYPDLDEEPGLMKSWEREVLNRTKR
ncbi:hypothetical protein ACFL0V_01090 [Nanoarchaeota archaeon]